MRDGELVVHFSTIGNPAQYTITHAATGRKVANADTLEESQKLMAQLAPHLVDMPTDLDSIDFTEWWGVKGRVIRQIIDDSIYKR